MLPKANGSLCAKKALKTQNEPELDEPGSYLFMSSNKVVSGNRWIVAIPQTLIPFDPAILISYQADQAPVN